jgi:hypothetical protein
MVHRAEHLLVCVIAIVSAAVLAISSVVIDSSAVPVTSANGVQAVRGYYSALNEYLQAGRQEVMTPYLQALPSPEAGVMPATGDQLGAAVELAALRTSYPLLRYQIATIDGDGDAVVAGVELDRGKERLPAWVDLAGAVGASQETIHVRIEDGAIGETARNAGGLPAYVDMVDTGARFGLATPARLTIAELRISGSETTTKRMPLPGPGVFIVQSGSLTVIGDGRAEITTLNTLERISIPPGVERTANPGDAIIVPLDKTIVRIARSTEATLLAAVMVPVESVPDRYFEREHIDETRMGFGLLDLLRELPEGAQPIWFGTAEVLSGQPAVTEAGLMSLEAGWLLVPPGDQVGLKDQGWTMALHSEAGELVIDEASWGETTLTNMGNETALVLVARAGDVKAV